MPGAFNLINSHDNAALTSWVVDRRDRLSRQHLRVPQPPRALRSSLLRAAVISWTSTRNLAAISRRLHTPYLPNRQLSTGCL